MSLPEFEMHFPEQSQEVESKDLEKEPKKDSWIKLETEKVPLGEFEIKEKKQVKQESLLKKVINKIFRKNK